MKREGQAEATMQTTSREVCQAVKRNEMEREEEGETTGEEASCDHGQEYQTG